MSFLRHAGIYRSDGAEGKTRGEAPPPVGRPPAPVQERDGRNCAFCSSSAMSSRAGYSLAGCSPAEPASASPTGSSMRWSITAGNQLPANGNLSLISVSQHRGSVQACPRIIPPDFPVPQLIASEPRSAPPPGAPKSLCEAGTKGWPMICHLTIFNPLDSRAWSRGWQVICHPLRKTGMSGQLTNSKYVLDWAA